MKNIPTGYSCTSCPYSSRTICRKYEAGQPRTERIKLVSWFKLEQCQLENGEYIRYGSSREGEVEMKYKPEDYIGSCFYEGGFGDNDIENYKEKVVKCRKPHKCMGGCDSEINIGEYALLETGFMDGKPVSCYTCLPCIEAWLEESGQVGMDEEEEEANDGR